MAASIVVADPDPRWSAAFATLADRIRSALGNTAVTVEHVGSTSVPGLAAKPIIDVLLLVPDSTDEAAYVPALESAGFAFHLREPDWYEHRLHKGSDIAANVHVFSVGCEEANRMLAFRDHLRADPPTAISMRRRSAGWPRRSGRQCRTTRTPRPRWSATSSPAPRFDPASGPSQP